MLRQFVANVVEQLCIPNLLPRAPLINFRYEAKACPSCGGPLHVLKTATRKVSTLHIGPLVAGETVMHCRKCPAGPLHSGELAKLVPPGGNFGYDVIVYAGRSMLLEHRTAEETAAALAARNVKIASRTVHELAARFVAYLGIAHLEAAPAVSELFGLNGGYILHLDSTSRKGSVKLLAGIDELTGLVLLSVKLRRETGDDVAQFLERIVELYGVPLAISCDMAAAIRCARLKVLRGIPVFICHFHFLRDAGKDMINSDYQLFRRLLDKHDLGDKLKRLQLTCQPHLTAHADAIEQALVKTATPQQQWSNLPAEVQFAVLVSSAAAAEHHGDGLGFPFDRPKLHCYQHLMLVCSAAGVIREHADSGKTQQLIDRLLKPLTGLRDDAQLAALAERLRANAEIFDELREAFRIAQPTVSIGLNDPGAPVEISVIEQAVNSFQAKHLSAEDEQLPMELLKLKEQIARHRPGLFRDPIRTTTSDGHTRLIQPQRTNNAMEHLFRDIGRSERRRTGLNLTARRLNAMLPDTPLACNLNNLDYKRILLDGSDTLAQRFSRIDPQPVRDSINEARNDGKIFSKPRAMSKILKDITTPHRLAIAAILRKISQLQTA